MSIHLKNMLAGRSLPSLKTRISADWNKYIKTVSILLLLIAVNAVAMKPGKSAGTKRDRAEQEQVDWRDTTLKSVFNNVLFPNTEKLRKKLAANKEDLNQLLTLEQKTVLYYAITKGNVENIQLLLEHGANPNVDLGNGVTVLHVACRLGNFEIVKMLLARGANPTNVTKSGKTIRDFANHSGNPEFLQSFNNMLNTKRPRGSIQEVPVKQDNEVPAFGDLRRSSLGSTADLMLAAQEAHESLTESDEPVVRELSAEEKWHEIEDVIGAYALFGLKKI